MTIQNILQGKKATYFTLGCKLNFAETSAIGQRLQELGVSKAEKGECADICVINTCSVTEVADQKCRQAIHRMVKNNPGAFVAVTGCYAELKPERIAAMPGVSIVVGTKDKGRIIDLIVDGIANSDNIKTQRQPVKEEGIPAFFPSCSRGDRTRYFLKVQDGCNYFCTYCTIPIARGRSRNGSIASLVEQARGVASEGGKEIVITGVNIGDFGRTTGESFLDLIKALDEVEGIERYRISSIEPNLLTEDIIDFCASSKHFMPHFHIPLQSGSDSVLKLMHRHYDTALFRQRINYIKRVMPDAFIGVDVIVGTRGETQEFFEESYRFIESLPISQLHVFSYSERPGTKALQIPHKVSQQEKHERSQRLLDLSKEKLERFYTSQIGRVRPVLFEHAPKTKPMHGFTDNYIRVETKNRPELNNSIVDVRLGEMTENRDALEVSGF
ncbi:MAG: tRNA (N(6)-L-threonylcarbamoyladenosine(37)-C(2))-methylthiotransferase MtaB [Bacteroidaceae bacterium]|nr:tRNA (N(6)-L-threonylcarbamoyladenosine(37)-C(2))-methylthiotransferase MtaB [Bacteroidaceae bacterium]MBP5523694.1 tRNA (N(6)-L-threonylcarbamoyladenosine(37)-C(2))-methylthiotransferase MtaB [Bacteroidaceae bacterium]